MIISKLSLCPLRSNDGRFSRMISCLEIRRGGCDLRLPTILLAASLMGTLVLAAGLPDPELTNYKNGISLTWSGAKGSDYMEEYLYFDKIIDDHKVVYIKSATSITAFHNSQNIAGNPNGSDSYVSADTTVGLVRYKVDGDHRFGLYPLSWSAYSAPFVFADLNYGLYGDAGTPVVGSTGDNGVAQTNTNKLTRYYRGILDSVGDEWHTLTMADDDSAVTSNNEFSSSDGKIWYFVINPKTPCLTWRVSGAGQFYTTPPKTYFVPYIHKQTTYFAAGSGGVTVEIRDINGNNVFYRINGGTFKDAGSSTVTLDQNAFVTGKNTLEYYYSGNSAYTKTRIVVKNPTYPSAGEVHGNRLWIDGTQWLNEVKPKLASNPDKAWWITQWQQGNKNAYQAAINYVARSGMRTTGTPSYGVDNGAFPNALVAKINGMDYKYGTAAHTAIDFAKLALFETRAILDPIGNELNTSEHSIPSRDMIYRGYYDVTPIYAAAAGYDIIAGDYRADQGYSNGLTPIEDYFIRDSLARWVHITGMEIGGWNDPYWYKFDGGGMWDTAHKTGGAMIACMMPSYSTSYFGTCGMDGNAVTFRDVIFPTLNHTWYDLLMDNNVAPIGYPDIAARIGVNDYLFLSDGKWLDRVAYANSTLMGHCFGLYYNLIKIFHPAKSLPNMDLAMTASATGQLYGTKFSNVGDSDPVFYPWIIMSNAWFPKFRAAVEPNIDRTVVGGEYNLGGPFYVLWHDMNLPLGKDVTKPIVTIPSAAIPIFSPPGATYAAPQTVTISSATQGATIRYTTDGSTPTATTGTVYSAPVAVAMSVTLNAIATGAGFLESPVQTAKYQIQSTVAIPTISPAGGKHMDNQSITITCGTPGATILYTLDGSNPVASSAVYNGPLVISSNTVIRAFGVLAGYQSSGIVTESYQIGSVATTDSVWDGAGFASKNKTFVVSCDVSPGTNSLVGLASGVTTEFTDLAAVVRFAPGGFVDARNGANYQASSVLAYTPGLTYRVVISVSMPACTYSATVAAPNATPVSIAKDFAFRTEQAAVSQLAYLAIWTQIGTMTVNKFGLSPSTVTGLKIETP